MTKILKTTSWSKTFASYRLLNSNRHLTFSFFFGKLKFSIQAKWYPLAFVSITELRKYNQRQNKILQGHALDVMNLLLQKFPLEIQCHLLGRSLCLYLCSRWILKGNREVKFKN